MRWRSGATAMRWRNCRCDSKVIEQQCGSQAANQQSINGPASFLNWGAKAISTPVHFLSPF
jgi:hypothetical protein